MNQQDQSTLTTIYRTMIGLTITAPFMALFITLPLNLPVVLTTALIANIILSAKYYTDTSRTSFERDIKKLLNFFVTSITVLFLTSIPAWIYSYMPVHDNMVMLKMKMLADLIEFLGELGAWGYYLVVVIMDYHQFKKMKNKKTNIFLA